MSWLGTDVVALGCILSGAVVGGAATYAVVGNGATETRPCAVAARAVAPSVTVTRTGETRTVVVRPHVRVRSDARCVDVADDLVEVRVARHLEGLEAHLENLERTLELRIEGLDGQLQARARQQAELQIQKAEAKIQAAQGGS